MSDRLWIVEDRLDAAMAELDRLRTANAALTDALRDVTDRFERACIASGTDPEYAAVACEQFRRTLEEHGK